MRDVPLMIKKLGDIVEEATNESLVGYTEVARKERYESRRIMVIQECLVLLEGMRSDSSNWEELISKMGDIDTSIERIRNKLMNLKHIT